MKKAKKSLSQNFINDKNICRKIIANSKIKNRDIIEIGPGYGNLTDFIINEKPKNLYLVEKDDELCKFLNEKYKVNKNIKIFNKDILNFDLTKFNNVIIISNLPYNLSSKIILHMFNNYKNISEMIFMIQKEMAYKFDYNMVKLNKYKFLTKIYCYYKRCFDVPPSVFFPKPKVSSTVVKFKFKKKYVNVSKLHIFVKNIFKNKRKKIYNNLKIKNIKNDEFNNKRVEELNINEILKIYNFF